MTAIIGLGEYPQTDDDTWSFINNAYQQGYIASNSYSFQGVYDDPDYAHLTIGGYNYEDIDGDIEWFNMTDYNSIGWRVPISNLIMDETTNLLTAPATDNDDDDFYLGAEEVSVITSYARFNTGYPFIGVDENVGPMVESALQFFKPDITCTYDVTYNPWNLCYYESACDDTWFPGTLAFSFGTNMTTFNLPIS